MKINKELATTIFKELYPERNLKRVKAIEFEYSPGRKNLKYTGDSSAFDVFFEYETEKNKNGIFGIEVKYAEDLNEAPSTHKITYETILSASGIFEMTNINRLKEKPIQQIWRDHLLTLSLFVTNNDYEIGDFIYLYPSGNLNCKSGIEEYKKIFKKDIESHFKPLTIEKLIETIKVYCTDKWIIDFENRYLKFKKIENVSR